MYIRRPTSAGTCTSGGLHQLVHVHQEAYISWYMYIRRPTSAGTCTSGEVSSDCGIGCSRVLEDQGEGVGKPPMFTLVLEEKKGKT